MTPCNPVPDLVDIARQSVRPISPDGAARIAAFLLDQAGLNPVAKDKKPN